MTFRLKLTMGSIAAILLANALLSVVTVVYLERAWTREVQKRVRLDLNAAHAAYDGRLQRMTAFLQAASLGRALAAAVDNPGSEDVGPLLDRLRKAAHLDFLVLLDSQGRLLQAGPSAEPSPQDRLSIPLVRRALARAEAAGGTVILSAEELAREGASLASRARFQLRDTPAAPPTADTIRSDGMVLSVAVPLLDREGRTARAVLFGGDLLSRRDDIVDQIRDTVFRDNRDDRDPRDTVTIFQADLRIATNVMDSEGRRATGTRMSEEVAQQVLERGGAWAAPAFVVNDWYITAYEPIRDPDQRVIGALYVGLLREPFTTARNRVTGVVVALVLAATVASLLLALFTTQLILRPVGKIMRMAQHVVRGDLGARVGIRPPGEIGMLCEAIDRMADSLAEREERLKTLARQQLGRSEKLASLGRLAAGVAHEINNPLTGVLTFAHLMREKPNMDDQDREDLDLIIHETSRAAEIVRGLLDFARERAACKEPLAINDVIQRTLRLISNQKSFDRIVIDEQLGHDLPDVEGDMNQLQQVLLNLALNACEAMPKGGRLTIHTSAEEDRVLVKLVDTGCGIKRADFDRIFEPFFTTKPVGKGTGLGLAVSYGIIQQHGGAIELESEEGHGTTFTIVLPALGQEPIRPSESAVPREHPFLSN